MVERSSERGKVTLCATCGDVMVNLDLLGQMVGTPLPAPAFGDETQRACPYCAEHMRSASIHGIALEGCASCGVLHTDTDSMRRMGIEARKAAGEAPSASTGTPAVLRQIDSIRNTEIAMKPHRVENLKFDGIFVLYRNGVLVDSFAGSVVRDLDRDVLGSMMVAITDFVETSFSCFGPGTPLESVKFRGREIAFEKGRFLVVVVVLQGTMDAVARRAIRQTLEAIEAQHVSTLDGWNGDLGTLKGISGSLRELAGNIPA
jgi:hypothetical protein